MDWRTAKDNYLNRVNDLVSTLWTNLPVNTIIGGRYSPAAEQAAMVVVFSLSAPGVSCWKKGLLKKKILRRWKQNKSIIKKKIFKEMKTKQTSKKICFSYLPRITEIVNLQKICRYLIGGKIRLEIYSSAGENFHCGKVAKLLEIFSQTKFFILLYCRQFIKITCIT